jgi:hypothetical protein
MKDFAAGQGWTPATDWIEANVYDWSRVTEYSGVIDLTGAPIIKLQQYQREILDVVLTPHQCTCPVKTTVDAQGKAMVTVPGTCHNHKEGLVGKFKYSPIVWSQPKKHGKTQIAGAVAAWFATKIEPPNFILTLASNEEQSAGLIFSALKPTIYALAGKVPTSTNAVPEIRMPNGTLLKAIPNNYAGAAGKNYGATFWSELWTYKSERDRKLWDELPPVPTRFNSIRWVETYAGFEDESELLKDLFLRVFEDFQEDKVRKISQQGNPVEPVPGLEHIVTGSGAKRRPACHHIPEEGLFMFWDHEIRAHVRDGGWITDQYMREQKAEARRSTYVRLWENRWQTSVGTFIEPEQWDDCVTQDDELWGPMVLAGDASERNDTTALVGVQRRKVKLFGKESTRYRVMRVRVWDPEGQDIDLDETIAREVKRVYEAGMLQGPFIYDPYQMHQVAVNLRKLGVPCRKFNQGKDRELADTFLWKLIKDGELDAYPSADLEAHVKSANAKEYENELVRIIKGTASDAKKVDAAVALSMACYVASGRHDRKLGKKPRTTSYSDVPA